jgi:hypothetical protein
MTCRRTIHLVIQNAAVKKILTLNHSGLSLANEENDGDSTDEERHHGASKRGVELAKTEHVNLCW